MRLFSALGTMFLLAAPGTALAQEAVIDEPGELETETVDEPAGSAAEAATPAVEPGTTRDDAVDPAASFEWPGEERPPIYETWWFWTAIGALVVGITLAIVFGVTTEHPASSRSGLVLRF